MDIIFDEVDLESFKLEFRFFNEMIKNCIKIFSLVICKFGILKEKNLQKEFFKLCGIYVFVGYSQFDRVQQLCLMFVLRIDGQEVILFYFQEKILFFY